MDPSEQTALSLYADEADSHEFSAEQELECARRLAFLREDIWRTLLGYYPYAERVAANLERELTPNNWAQVAGAAAIYVGAAEAVRARSCREHRDVFDQSVRELASLLATIDLDRVLSDRLAQEVHAIARGERSAVLNLRCSARSLRAVVPLARQVEAVTSKIDATRQEFAKANLRLVMRVARRCGTRIDLDERVACGNLGLLKAIDRFDPDRGSRFSTYAAWWIRDSIRRGGVDASSTIRLPMHLHKLRDRIVRMRIPFVSVHGRAPTPEELAELCQVSLHKVQQVQEVFCDTGLWTPVEYVEGCGNHGPMSARRNALRDQEPLIDEQLERERTMRKLSRMVSSLPERLQEVIRLRFGLDGEDPMTLREVGERFNLSRERIRQIEELALEQLREMAEVAEVE